MGCTEQQIENISGYSKAKYSTWLFYRPDRLLLDAGEGVATSLGNFVYGIEQIFLSHGHFDHIGGIPGLLRSRLSSRGDKEKPLEIYYPLDCRPVEELRRYLDDSIDFRSFEVSWRPVEDGQRIALRTGGKQREIVASRTQHIRGQLTLAYTLAEHRRRRKPQYTGLDEAELRRLAVVERVELMEPYEAKLLVFSGDCMPLALEQVMDAELLIHDTTFLSEKDRDRDTHATLQEVMELAQSARVKGLLLFHISSRYTSSELRRRVAAEIAIRNPDYPIWWLDFKSGLRRNPVSASDGADTATTRDTKAGDKQRAGA